MIKLLPLLEIKIDTRSLKDLITEFLHSDEEWFYLEELINFSQEGNSFENYLREWGGSDQEDLLKLIYIQLQKDPKVIKWVNINENELEEVDIREYRTLLAMTTYPDSNQATGNIILIK